jgi:uncharacterized protein (DUF302 family)
MDIDEVVVAGLNLQSGAQEHTETFGMTTPDNISVVPSDATFEETLKRLREAIAERGLTLFAEIDHAENARAAGLEMPPSTVLIFGSAVAGTPLMMKSPDIGLELPLRVLVREEGTGGAVLAYGDPQRLARAFNVEEIAAGIMSLPVLVHAVARS